MKYMKYMKYFDSYTYEITHNEPNGFRRYIMNINGDKYELEFLTGIRKDNVFYREFTGHHDYKTQKNAFEVGRCLGELTKKFLEEVKPDALLIPHVSSKGEKVGRYLNQRAKLGLRYMKGVMGYKLSYYRTLLEPRTTYCYIQREGFNKTFAEVQGISKEICIPVQ